MMSIGNHGAAAAARILASRNRNRIAQVTLLVIGAVGTISVVAARGLNAVSGREVVTLAAVILAGAGAQAAPGDGASGRMRAIGAIAWMIAALVLVNLALAWIDLDHWSWQAPDYLPSRNPVGLDFRAAYAAAQQFSNGPTGWPPFTVVLAVPYLLFGPDAAYVIHVGVLIGVNVVAILLAVAVLRSLDVDGAPLGGAEGDGVGLLAPIFVVWLFVSDGFLFSVERGNFDAFPAVLAMLGLWLMVKRPARVWPAVIAFSVAAAIKLYPALLLLLVVWRYRRRSIVPLVVSNVVLALSAGPGNLANFVSAVGTFVAADYYSASNSSAKSFSGFVDALYGLHLPVGALIAVPIAIGLVTAWRLWRRQDLAATALMLCALVPLMLVVPNISNDYKLVLFAGPAALLAGLLMRHIGRGSAEPWWMLLALLMVLFFIATPPALVWPPILANKYPWIILFQVIVAWIAWRLPVPVRRSGDLSQHEGSAQGEGDRGPIVRAERSGSG